MHARVRFVVAVSLLAVSGAGCALLDGGSEVADCEAVKAAFEDTLGHVRGTGQGTVEDDDDVDVGEAALRDAVTLHDARQECFDSEHREFLDPARAQFDDGDAFAPLGGDAGLDEPPPAVLGDPPAGAGD